MTSQEAFEKWYIETYWNFHDGKVTYNEEKAAYTHYDVDLAWNAWQASLITSRVFFQNHG